MVALVTVDEATARTRIDDVDEDTTIQSIIEEASAIVVKHIKKPDHGWTAQTAPADIKSAVLLVAARIYADREGEEEWLNVSARNLLVGHRDPTLV